MINSFCIETPVPVSGSAQGHVETHRQKAKVTYCHGNSCARRSEFSPLLNSVRAKLNKTLGANPRLNRNIACSPSIHVTAAADAHDKSDGGKRHQNRRSAIAQEWKGYACCRHESNHHSDIHDQ